MLQSHFTTGVVDPKQDKTAGWAVEGFGLAAFTFGLEEWTMIKAGLLKFVHQITAHAYMRICVALLAGFTAFFAMTVTAYAYIGRTDSPPGTAGSIIPNGQIVGGLPFLIQHTDDATLTSIQDRGDLYKYGPDGIPIRNGTDSLGGIWGFDHVSHNGTPISENNGYKMVGQSTVGTWIAALKGDPSYVASH